MANGIFAVRPAVAFHETIRPWEVRGYARSSPATAVAATSATGPVIREFARNAYAYGYDAAFAHSSKLAALLAPPSRNLLGASQDARPNNALGLWNDFDGTISEFPPSTFSESNEDGPLGEVDQVLFALAGTPRDWEAFVRAPPGIYTFSGYLRGFANGIATPTAAINVEADGGNELEGIYVSESVAMSTAAWQPFAVTFDHTDPGDEDLIRLRFSFPDSSVMWTPQALQLEPGPAATPWIRTPEASFEGIDVAREATVIELESAGQRVVLANLGDGPEVLDGEFELVNAIGDLVPDIRRT